MSWPKKKDFTYNLKRLCKCGCGEYIPDHYKKNRFYCHLHQPNKKLDPAHFTYHLKKKCKCGCGELMPDTSVRPYIQGHLTPELAKNEAIKKRAIKKGSTIHTETRYCKCGCGEKLNNYTRFAYIVGHYKRELELNKKKLKYCKCGCGLLIPKKDTWYKDHKPNKSIKKWLDKTHNYCKCGCGALIVPPNIYKMGHQHRDPESIKSRLKAYRVHWNNPEWLKWKSEIQKEAFARLDQETQKRILAAMKYAGKLKY